MKRTTAQYLSDNAAGTMATSSARKRRKEAGVAGSWQLVVSSHPVAEGELTESAGKNCGKG